jgi:phage terminase large subunit-like protein
MVKASADLRRIVTIFKDNLSLPESAARYVPLGADSDTMDGLNVHGAIIDELHAHKTRGVVDVLETATGARRQPMIFEITTAGWDQQSICREHHDYSRSVLSGTISDDSWFAFIASADEGDNWQDPDTWRKANPNYEITVKPDDLFRKAEKAAHLPAAQNTFKRLHLNLWTQQADRWINLEQWDSNNLYPIKEEDLAGHICYGGLDLASVSDLAAWVMVFPMEGGEYNVLARFWCPVEKLTDSRNRYREQYQVWAKKGWLRVSPGPTIDYSQVREQILEDSRRFRLVDLNVDRLFQAHQIAGELQEAGLTVFGMGQGFMSMAAPMRELERLILARQLNHGGNPILRWMADNVAVKTDPAGNRKPDKASSQGKIDGIVALVMALDRACRYQVQTPHYEERGLWLI